MKIEEYAGNDQRRDIAVIELDRPTDIEPIPYRRNTTPVTVGSKIYTFGYPLGVPLKVSEGSIKAVDKETGAFASSTTTNHGMSGGPIVNENGILEGVHTGGNHARVQEDQLCGKGHYSFRYRTAPQQEYKLMTTIDNVTLFTGSGHASVGLVSSALDKIPDAPSSSSTQNPIRR